MVVAVQQAKEILVEMHRLALMVAQVAEVLELLAVMEALMAEMVV
jgi:hypothetical protein